MLRIKCGPMAVLSDRGNEGLDQMFREAADGFASMDEPRGEVYARQYELQDSGPPRALGDIEIMPLTTITGFGPWSAAEALDLGDAERAPIVRSSAEALLFLASMGAAPDELEPMYVEGPPIHRAPDGF